ncbi:MAG TPA: M20/M25/M40 family metallo-hydrolase [Longimicrobiales bacterium]|nr:M20/M25/M40 family metallo-hydrolase [Longimicrobiales bacterium]
MTQICAFRVRVAAAAAATLLVPASTHAQAGAPIGQAAFDSAYYAWQAGTYADALTQLDRLLSGPDAHRWLEPAAILTGELYSTVELAADGRSVAWSPDGRHVSWETGSGVDRRAHVARIEDGRVAGGIELEGHSPAFDGASRVYYITVPDSPELAAARAAVTAAVESRNSQESFRARSRVSQLEAAAARLMVRDAAGGAAAQVDLGGIIPQAVVMRPGDAGLHVLGAPAGAGDTNHLYRIADGAAQQLTTAEGPKRDVVFLTGERLLYGIDRQSFAIQDLATSTVTTHQGTQVTVSGDGSTVAFVRQDGDDNVITVLRADGTAHEAVRRSEPVSSPALSRDGSRIVYQAMPREDWELYVTGPDSTAEVRLTREIQHDLMPRFTDNDHVFAVMGEARHRRSYLYDVRTGERTRLFHNNTVRTVAPEYEWVLSPDGTMVLIVAERDGDTVSPERGVYLMNLGQRVGLSEVQTRVREQLASEQSLRATGHRLFALIEDDVRAAVNEVSTDRIYQYELDLFRFDSKHIMQPGNARAIEYLAAKLREFGYEPELQWFEARGVRTANVIARLPGTVQPDVLYTVSSHFDSVERGPGSDDDTSGTAALLEAARVLSGRPQPATIHFAFFTGEEAGLLGSREYVRRAVENGDQLVGALNNDMIGFANDQRLDNTIRYSNPGIRDIQHGAAMLFTDLITYDAKYYKSTDAHAYYDAYGDIVGGIGSYPILGNPHYHQTHDQLETINHQLVAEVSKTTVATLMKLASSPSRVKNLTVTRTSRGAQVEWDALPETDVAAYVVEWGQPGAPPRNAVRVVDNSATVPDLTEGEEVRVLGINTLGAVSWDSARAR